LKSIGILCGQILADISDLLTKITKMPKNEGLRFYAEKVLKQYNILGGDGRWNGELYLIIQDCSKCVFSLHIVLIFGGVLDNTSST
jgi:hypothetical protein